MTNSAAWYFPAIEAGKWRGLTNPAGEHFTGDRIAGAIRETLQNSLDAPLEGSDVVTVKFTEIEVDLSSFDGSQLSQHIEACLNEHNIQKDPEAFSELQRAKKILEPSSVEPSSVRCLSIVDEGTTGLCETENGDKFQALVESECLVEKDDHSGGSFGIGKNAALQLSEIFTVIYSTRYLGSERLGRVEKCTGVAELSTHSMPDDDLKIAKDKCGFWRRSAHEPLFGNEIPDIFRLDKTGTGVFIMGFNPYCKEEEWVNNVVRAVIDNYFAAIHEKKLIVEIHALPDSQITINHESIGIQFEKFSQNSQSHMFYKAIRDKKITDFKTEFDKLGKIDLYLDIEEGPRTVGYVNRNGMLITASRDINTNPFRPRKAFPRDYTAVVVPLSDEGDKWIRGMENPAHNQICPQKIKDVNNSEAAKSILKNVRDSISQFIQESMQFDISATDNLNELASFFPEEFGEEQGGNGLETGIERLHLNVKPYEFKPPSPPRYSEPDNNPENPVIPPEPGPEPPGPPQPTPPLPPRPPRPGKKIKRSIDNQRVVKTSHNEIIVYFDIQLVDINKVRFSLHPRGYEATREYPLQIAEICNDGSGFAGTIDGNCIVLKPQQSTSRIKLILRTTDSISSSAFSLVEDLQQ